MIARRSNLRSVTRRGSPHHWRVGGSTLIELVIAMILGALIIGSLGRIVTTALASNDDARKRNLLVGEARFALQRITQNVQTTRLLLLPKVDNPGTAYSEAVYEPGVLAMTLSASLDRDLDGIMDADNDGDGLIDEDPSGDLTNDLATGIIGIDDDNDGSIDEPHGGAGPAEDDDDEDGVANEDGWDGIDDDSDLTFDEDPKKDMSGDAAAGLIGVDDDGDGSTDEGDKNDDDEDGLVNEDWFDAVVYFVSGTKLIERFPDLQAVDGTDFTERTIADNVTRFRVERLPLGTNRSELVVITLDLAVGKDSISIEQNIRVGGL